MTQIHKTRRAFTLPTVALATLALSSFSIVSAADLAGSKAADMTKPVQVFILMGQSNMVGLGKVTGPDGSLEFAVKEKKKYPYLVDEAGAWFERKDVRFARVMSGRGGGMQTSFFHNR